MRSWQVLIFWLLGKFPATPSDSIILCAKTLKYLQQGRLRPLGRLATAISPNDFEELCHGGVKLIGVLQCALCQSHSGLKVIR